MKKTVLWIILDGFSSKYVQEDFCPNLCSIAKENYYSAIEPLFGFQGVGAAIFSGASMNTTRFFTEYALRNAGAGAIPQQPYFQALLKLTDYVPNDWLCPVSRHLLYRLFRKRGEGISNVIPSELMKYFYPKISKQLSEKSSLDLVPTIFDVMRTNRLDYFYQMPSTMTENALINNIIRQTENSRLPKLTVIHPCGLDIIGHNFGPESSQVQCALKKIDSRMLSINRAVQQSHDEITVIIMSDHGMTPVNNKANLLNTLGHLHLEMGKDYLVFLDSTVARFWFFNGNARKLVSEQLSNLKCGRILDACDLRALGIDEIGQEYGELFFAINEGCVIFPDFFRKQFPPRGMHGYAFSTYDTPIFVAYTSSPSAVFRGKNAVRFIDIMPTILEMFNLPVPSTCEGTSFKL